MNREARRAAAAAANRAARAEGKPPPASTVPTTGVRFRCSGVDDGGCPNRDAVIVAVGLRPRDGISLPSLQAGLRSAGWSLGAGETTLAQGTVRWLDPLCPHCTGRLSARHPEPVPAPQVGFTPRPLDETTPHAYERAGDSPAAGSLASAIGAWPCRRCGEGPDAPVHRGEGG